MSYDNFVALADRLIRKRGGVLTLTRTTPGTYDPATSTTPSPTVVVHTGWAVRSDYKLKDIDGTRVLAGDVQLIISPKTAAGGAFPKPAPSTDVLALGGQNYTVIDVDTWNFDGATNVGFLVQARGIQ